MTGIKISDILYADLFTDAVRKEQRTPNIKKHQQHHQKQ